MPVTSLSLTLTVISPVSLSIDTAGAFGPIKSNSPSILSCNEVTASEMLFATEPSVVASPLRVVTAASRSAARSTKDRMP